MQKLLSVWFVKKFYGPLNKIPFKSELLEKTTIKLHLKILTELTVFWKSSQARNQETILDN